MYFYLWHSWGCNIKWMWNIFLTRKQESSSVYSTYLKLNTQKVMGMQRQCFIVKNCISRPCGGKWTEWRQDTRKERTTIPVTDITKRHWELLHEKQIMNYNLPTAKKFLGYFTTIQYVSQPMNTVLNPQQLWHRKRKGNRIIFWLYWSSFSR